MTSIAVNSLVGGETRLDETAVGALAASVRGPLVLPGTPGYDVHRAVWNGMIDRKPGFIVRCIGAADVMACVAFAREHGLEVCMKGGGHNIAGLAVKDGAMMLDMSLMRGVHVDAENRTVYAQAGCTLGDVDRETQLHGLAAVLGFVSNTGITGLTLGGGFGYLSRRFGWTCDTVRSFRIVTADGRFRRASETEEPDLFWGLRGGGGNFGVVTEIAYDLHEVGPQIVGGAVAWRMEDAPAVLDLLAEVNAQAPPEHVVVGVIRPAPPAPWLPKEVHGKLIAALFVCDTGPLDGATERAARIKGFGSPVGDVVQPRPYITQQALLDATQPNGRRYYWKSEYLAGLDGEFLKVFLKHAERMASPHSAMLLFPLHGALNTLPEDHSAVGNRKTGMVVNIAASWDDPEEDAVHVGWTRDAWSDMRPFSTGGTYINFQTDDEGDDRIQAAYGANYDRLAAVKAAYDPGNMFRVNKNVAPRV